jgi:transcriptional regulator with GAF, ATPase, and Fis domain
MSEVSGMPAGGREGSGEDGNHSDARRRERLLARAFVRLADTLADEFDLVEFLHGLSVDSVEIIGAEAASVMLPDTSGALRVVASSEERMRVLELFEIQSAQGPCLDAFGSGRAVQASAAESRRRWPVFALRASEAGFNVMCAVPLRARTDTIGALNIFRGNDEPFSDAELEIARAMAQVATIALIQERAIRERSLLVEQLQAALRSRVVIEQAKGMLAEHLSTTVDEAFQLLNKYARDRNRKLTDLARDVVDRKLSHDAFAIRPAG